MSDAISRSAMARVVEQSSKDAGLHHADAQKFLRWLRKAPTIDAVPVVRCKDCRYSEPMPDRGVSKFGADALNCTQCRGDDGYGYVGISMIRTDDFCSDGALKDGEADG